MLARSYNGLPPSIRPKGCSPVPTARAATPGAAPRDRAVHSRAPRAPHADRLPDKRRARPATRTTARPQRAGRCRAADTTSAPCPRSCRPASRPRSASPRGAVWRSCFWTRSAGTRPSMDWRAPRAPACSETLDQVLRGLLWRSVEVEGADEPAILVHEIDESRVLQGVVAILERHLAGVGPIG